MSEATFLHTIDLLISLTAGLFIILIGLAVLGAAVLYVIDITQTTHAIRRNYPLVGRFRYLFERMGEYFRQYFFAMDREEMPFNRAQRSWCYRAAKDVDNTIAFGSTRDITPHGTLIFVNCPFPTLAEDTVPPKPLLVGPHCRTPFNAPSFYNISGMSYGAISKPAVRALSHGAKAANVWLNTGEGGLSAHHLEGGADIVFQIGTANYGVRDADGQLSDDRLREVAAHEQVRMFEIKLAQGAKPGKGGILPGAKVTPEIAAIRHIPMGEDSISPNRHLDINSVDDLLDKINHIRDVTGKPVGFKTVIGTTDWIDALTDAIHKRGAECAPDFITIDSADGGTGAAPMSLMDYMGLNVTESLPIVVDKLSRAGLKDRIRVIASGKLVTPSVVAWALCVGADFVVSARGFMFALGCIMALQCNKNTCPTGVTTHDPRLQRGLVVGDKTVRVAHYAANMMKEVGVIAHSCGVAEPHALKRYHARIVQENGTSASLDEIYPYLNPPTKGAA
ncbi:MAG: FMN-binding glutamate synthase family protein [Sphingomonadales bacterium]